MGLNYKGERLIPRHILVAGFEKAAADFKESKVCYNTGEFLCMC